MQDARLAPGIILICLGIICYSIFSKVWLLALVLETYLFVSQQNADDSRLHLPVLPFLASFLAEMAQTDMGYFIPSRVLVGFGSGMLYVVLNRFNLEAGSAKK